MGIVGDELKVYVAAKADETLSPSNMTEESIWENVPASGNFRRFGGGEPVTQKTNFQVLYNKKHLFVKVNASDEKAAEIDFSAKNFPRDSLEVFNYPHIEFFIDGELTRSVALQSVTSVRGGLFDRLESDTNFNYDSKFAVKHDEKSWTIYAAFPWKDRGMDNRFGMMPHTNPVIGFNVCRGRKVAPNESSQWSSTKNAYMRPGEFGILLLADEEKLPFVTKRLFESSVASGGIDLEGDYKKVAELFPDMEDFYREQALGVILKIRKLIQLLPAQPQTSARKKTDDYEEKLKKTCDSDEAKRLLKEISDFYSGLDKKIFHELDAELLKEF